MKIPINRAGYLIVVLLIAGIALNLFRKSGPPGRSGHGDEAASGIITRSSDRAGPDPERERRRRESVSIAAQKWYEELLEAYPRMKPVYRDVPDERNGYLQFILLAERMEKPILPIDWENMAFQGDSAWDAAKFKAWLAEHQDYFDEVLRIAELPDRSIKGIAFDRLINGPSRLSNEFSGILRASARLAFENGDEETALRYMKASSGLGDHLVDIEVPSMLGEVVSIGIRNRGLDFFRDNFLPSLVNDPVALKRWNEVIFRHEQPAAEYARAMIGEWNTGVRSFLLPTILGDHSVVEKALPVGDVTELVGAYTRTIQKTADGALKSGANRFDVSEASLAFSPSAEPDRKPVREPGKITAADLSASLRGLAEAFGVDSTRTALNSAAISILLGESPKVDPVSGEAFFWNAGTRTLSAPGKENTVDPIVLPRQNP